MRTREAILPILSITLSLASAITASVGCTRKIPEPEPVPAQPVALTQDKASGDTKPTEAPPPPAPEEKKGPSEDFVGYPKEGWTKVKLSDESMPLCVFANELERFNAKFADQAKKQTLKANQPVVFGAYAPYCISKECDDLPTLQCVATREGNTLKVISRYIGYHKDGTKCTEDCAQVTAGCPTPELEPGKYTVQYGDKQYTLKIPSTLRSPCFQK